MTRHLRFVLALALPLAGAPALYAQTTAPAHTGDAPASAPATSTDDDQAAAAAAEASWKTGRPITIRYYRPLDKRGLNVFETTKEPGADFTGFKIDFGAAFTSSFTRCVRQGDNKLILRACGKQRRPFHGIEKFGNVNK